MPSQPHPKEKAFIYTYFGQRFRLKHHNADDPNQRDRWLADITRAALQALTTATLVLPSTDVFLLTVRMKFGGKATLLRARRRHGGKKTRQVHLFLRQFCLVVGKRSKSHMSWLGVATGDDNERHTGSS